ncbi:MAG: G1 family glutamic endopeptidase [Candidatus Dormibacteria bacterium]
MAGVDGVPGTATAVALNVTVTDTTAASYLSVYPSGGGRPVVSNLNWAQGETVPNLVIVPVGTNGQASFYNYAGRTDVVVDLEGYFASEAVGSTAGSYVPITPTRVVDTRSGSGLSSAGMTIGAGGALSFTATGAGNGPSTGVTAVLMNVTVTNTTAASYLTAFPEGATQPLASNLNWVRGETVANRVVVPVSSTGRVTLYNSTGSTDVIADINGYFTNGSSTASNASLFTAITPVRVLDTRQTSGPLGAGATLTQQMSGVDGISSTASAVVTNVTAADTTAASFFTVYPGGSQPTASDVNWGAGQIVPNLTVATLSSSGSISIYNNAGSADVIVDAFGYFSPLAATTTLVITTTSLSAATAGVAYSTTLAASGGTAPYSWAITSGSLPSGLTLSVGGSITGIPSAAGTASFGVQATDSTTPTAETATAQLSLSVASAATSTVQSPNWSGYVAGNGPYTAVQGTFNVPSIYASSTNTDTAEWVGIDGYPHTNTSLIQAGIDEPYDASTNTYQIRAWWEILPAYPTMVLIPAVDMSVATGDSIAVTIGQVSGTVWGITVTDNTTGQTFTTDQTYTGPLASAEWIVEAPTTESTGTVRTLGGYSPDVTFSNLRMAGPEAALTDEIMVQNGVQVSTPSALTSSGFNVAYTGP